MGASVQPQLDHVTVQAADRKAQKHRKQPAVAPPDDGDQLAVLRAILARLDDLALQLHRPQ